MTLQSTKIVYTIFPGTKTNLLKSNISDSLTPLSTTLASSMVSSSGGPGSTCGDAMGSTSAVIIIAPLFSNPSKGSPVSTFTPATTSVLPNLTQADPLAFLMTSNSTSSGLISSKLRPSNRLPDEIDSLICLFRRFSTIMVDFLDILIILSTPFHRQSTFPLKRNVVFHILSYIREFLHPNKY